MQSKQSLSEVLTYPCMANKCSKTTKRCNSKPSSLDPERMERLARPTSRRLQSLWNEKCEVLEPHRRDNVKRALEEDYFMTPEQTEEYFRAMRKTLIQRDRVTTFQAERHEKEMQAREMEQRSKWLISFSAQIAYRLCEYLSHGHKDTITSNRLKSIADVVLERVAEILGEPKPSRSSGTRLARFMVAVSDRIAVWIENAVYRADALELMPQESEAEESQGDDMPE